MKLQELIHEVMETSKNAIAELDTIIPPENFNNINLYRAHISRAKTQYESLEKNPHSGEKEAALYRFIFWEGYIDLLSVLDMLRPPQTNHKDANPWLERKHKHSAILIEKWLSLEDIDLNRVIPGIDTTILEEICGGFDNLVELALSKGCNPNMSGTDRVFGNTPLTWAIANDVKEVAVTLIDACNRLNIDINLNLPSKYNKNTPLILSIAKGHKRPDEMSNYVLTEFLLSKGADSNISDANGFTPLHYAFLRRDEATIHLLEKFGADYAIKNKDGKTPIDMLKISYQACKDKVFEITRGHDQGSCSFPSEKEFNKYHSSLIEYVDKLQDNLLKDKLKLTTSLKPKLFKPRRPLTMRGEGKLSSKFKPKK